MKRYPAYYFLLFVLLITGAFALMAQNKYGQTLMGFVAVCFTVLFVYQLISGFTQQPKDWLNLFELMGLSVLSVVFALNIFYLSKPWMQWAVLLAGITLSGLYTEKIVRFLTSPHRKIAPLNWVVPLYYGSLILCVLALVLVSVQPGVSGMMGLAALLGLVVFGLALWMNQKVYVAGEEFSMYKFIVQYKDRSFLVVTLFLMVALYTLGTQTRLLPAMYSSEYPQAYYRLSNNTGAANVSAAELKKKQEEFKIQYDRLALRHLKNQ